MNKDPIKKILLHKNKTKVLMDGCCNKVLQCNNPNEWLAKNWDNNDLKCPKSKPPLIRILEILNHIAGRV